MLRGKSTPTFEAPVYHSLHGNAFVVGVAASFFGDGLMDLAVALQKANGVSNGVTLLPHACE